MIQLLAKPVAEQILKQVKLRTEHFIKNQNRNPKLVVVLVGDDPASVIYTRKKGEKAIELGLSHETLNLPSTSTPDEVRSIVDDLNRDPKVDGILIQRPLPKSFHEKDVVYWIAPEKDVDAFHPLNAGRLYLGLPCLQPCTPAGIMELLRFYKISLAGKRACIIGRSPIVGKPMGALLLKENATVFQCHSQTPGLKEISTQAEIVIVAAGKVAQFDMTYFKKNAVVVDVGVHRTPEGKLVGDVQSDPGLENHLSALTPVPGGVGPMTIALLMRNTLQAAEDSV